MIELVVIIVTNCLLQYSLSYTYFVAFLLIFVQRGSRISTAISRR